MALRFQNRVTPAVSSGASPEAAALSDVGAVLAGAGVAVARRKKQQDEILENGEIAKRRIEISAIDAELSAKHPGLLDSDLQNYKKEFNSRIASLEAPSSLRVQRETQLDLLNIRTRSEGRINGTIERRQHAQAVTNIGIQLQSDMDRAGKIARDFSVDQGREQELATLTAKYSSDLGSLLRSGDITPDQHDEKLREFAAHNLNESTIGDFMRAGFPQQTIEDIAAGKVANELPLEDRDRLVAR